MNKYIDNLTVAEYETILQQLEQRVETEHEKMLKTGNTKTYIELRFIIIKIKKIIAKYKKS